MELNALTALSPIDGRYARQTDALRGIFSEYAFMNARVRVEVEWLIALSEAGFEELPRISESGQAFLRGLYENFSLEDCEAVKTIEKTTNHDVKAVEYWIKDRVAHDDELKTAAEFVHFACTSEDINNTSHALMRKAARRSSNTSKRSTRRSRASPRNGPKSRCSRAPTVRRPRPRPSARNSRTWPFVSAA
jgi:adenylosuccinate lyase